MEVASENDGYFSAVELARLRIPGLLIGERAIRDKAEREGWLFIVVSSRGRKGETKKFKPPERFSALIEQRLRGDLPPAPPAVAPKTPRASHPVNTAADSAPSLYTYRGEVPAERPQGVDAALLRLCLGACTLVYGESFARQPAALQLEHAAALYNQVARHAAAHRDGLSAGLAAFARLETRGLADQLRLFLQMGLLTPWPDPAQPSDNPESPA